MIRGLHCLSFHSNGRRGMHACIDVQVCTRVYTGGSTHVGLRRELGQCVGDGISVIVPETTVPARHYLPPPGR